MENKYKAKLKRRGTDMYRKYFFNPDNILNLLVEQYDTTKTVDESLCSVIFDLPDLFMPQIYELISYYPNKLREIKYINEEVINRLYTQYGTTIKLMNKYQSGKNVRGKICDNVVKRSKELNIPINIINEDIILVENCPYLHIPLEYGNNKTTNYSASLDKIIPELGYVIGNIQVVSMLANQMKSCATNDQLLTFADSVNKLHKQLNPT